jgi:hypothetical protein
MRHRWRKRNFKQKWYEDKTDIVIREVKIYDTKECIHCGLRKGSSREYGFFPQLVYFTPDRGVISTGKIPFPCQSEWIGGELPILKNIIFIEENEFQV